MFERKREKKQRMVRPFGRFIYPKKLVNDESVKFTYVVNVP